MWLMMWLAICMENPMANNKSYYELSQMFTGDKKLQCTEVLEPLHVEYYKPTYFELQELVDPQTYIDNGELAWLFLDARLLITLDRLREKYGPMIVNTWSLSNYDGKYLRFRGYRPRTYNSGAAYSQHRHGRAMDVNFVRITVEQVRADIMDDPNDPAFEYITGLELDVNWLHFECTNWDKKTLGLRLYKPNR